MWKYFDNDNFPDVANCAVVIQEIVSIFKKYTLMYLGLKKQHDRYNLLSNDSEKKDISLLLYRTIYIYILICLV